MRAQTIRLIGMALSVMLLVAFSLPASGSARPAKPAAGAKAKQQRAAAKRQSAAKRRAIVRRCARTRIARTKKFTCRIITAKASAITAVPTGLKVVKTGDRRVELDWNDNAGSFGRYQVYRDNVLVANGPTASSFVDTGVTNGRTYSYRVSAGTAGSYSAWTAAVTATPNPFAPAVPTGLTVVAAGDGQVQLDWADNSGSFGAYQVYRDGQIIAESVATSQFADSGLVNGRTYSYRVGAGAAPTWSDWTAAVSATPAAPAPVKPAAPTGLRVVSTGDGRVSLDWSDIADIGSGHYQVYRDGALVADGRTASAFDDAGLVNGRAYSYTVAAVVNGVASDRPAAVTATPTAPVILTPPVPTGLRVVSAGNARVDLDWNDADLQGYRYQVYRDNVLIADGVTTSAYSDTSVTNGRTYTYRVGSGTDPVYSAWTAAVSATPAAPVQNTAPLVPSTPTTGSSPFFLGDALSKFQVQTSNSAHGSGASMVADPAGSGKSVIRLRAVEQDAAGGVVRAQAVGPSNLTAGKDYWDVAGFYVPSNFPSVSAWQAVFSFYGPPYAGSPNNIIGIHGNQVDIQWASGSQHIWSAPLAKGQWNNMARRYRLATDGTGWIELYYSVGNQPLQQVKFVNGQTRYYGPTLDSTNGGGANNFRISNYRKPAMPGFGDNSIFYRSVAQWPGTASLSDINARYFG